MASPESQLEQSTNAFRQRHVHHGRSHNGGHFTFGDRVRLQRGIGLLPQHRRGLGDQSFRTKSRDDTAQRALGQEQRSPDIRLAGAERKTEVQIIMRKREKRFAGVNKYTVVLVLYSAVYLLNTFFNYKV